MFSLDILLQLPPAATLLLLPSLFELTACHALPRQTKTVELRELDALPWPLHPPLATPGPVLAALELRQLNTVCGYIGGDPALPATCSAGSHCAVDVEHGAMGCCPDGGACTAGIFTGCVDSNSDPQTELDPYVYTCSGSNVCYKNSFEGGFFQYGCGSASDLGTTVAMTASGKASLDLSSLSVELTAEPTTLSEPTTIGTRTKTETTETTSTSTSETKTKTRTKTETETSSETTTVKETSTDSSSTAASTNTESSAPDANDDGDQPVGAIVGGTIGGVAGLVALVALGIFLWRRKKGNTRQGPGTDQESKYISPATNDRHNFEPLPTMQEVDEAELRHAVPPAHRLSGEISSDSNSNEGGAVPYQPAYPYGYGPGSMAGGVMAVGGEEEHMEPDRVPLTGEYDDFTRGYNSGLEEIREEDEAPPQNNEYNMGAYPGPRGDRGTALWQQNRRQSRNLSWM